MGKCHISVTWGLRMRDATRYRFETIRGRHLDDAVAFDGLNNGHGYRMAHQDRGFLLTLVASLPEPAYREWEGMRTYLDEHYAAWYGKVVAEVTAGPRITA